MATASPTASSKVTIHGRYGDPSPWWHVDLTMVATTIAIALIGIAMVFSATKGNGAVADTSYLKRLLLFMGIGVVAMIVASLVDYQRLLAWSWGFYGVLMFLLVAVLFVGVNEKEKGSKAWFGFGPFQMQPAEFGKLAVILVLANLLGQWRADVDLRRLGLLIAVPGGAMVLIMKQPDLGMVLIYLFIVMGMLLVGGVKARHLVGLMAAGVIGVFGVLNSSVLAQYQKDRLTSFADSNNNLKISYNVVQSETTIGSGGITGQGYGRGSQTQLNFVPEQETDFIFTVVGEELGFVGGATLLLLYGLLSWRIWRVAQLARDRSGQLICVGVMCFIVFQVFENVGMAMRIMPVTGIPLPLVSYGGSSILTTFIALGLVQNIHMHRFR